MSVDAVSRKFIGTRNGKQRLSTLLAHKNAQKKNVRLGNPSQEEMRECIKDQWCWWCDSGPWKNLAAHTSKAHFIMATDIRELAYLLKRAKICSEEHSYASGIRFQHLLETGQVIRGKGQRSPKVFSTAGLDLQKESGEKRFRSASFIEGKLLWHGSVTKSHPCPICGVIVPRSRPNHCSEECSRKAWRYHSGPNVKLSETRKRMFASGELKPSKQCTKSHDCPVCGKFIRKSKPAFCSSECVKIYISKRFAKPHPCPVCGKGLPKAHPKTCSKECRKIIRQDTVRKTHERMRRERGNI